MTRTGDDGTDRTSSRPPQFSLLTTALVMQMVLCLDPPAARCQANSHSAAKGPFGITSYDNPDLREANLVVSLPRQKKNKSFAGRLRV